MNFDGTKMYSGMDQVRAGLSMLRTKLPEVLHDPRAFPREAMTLAAIVAFVVVFLMLVGFLIAAIVNDVIRNQRLRTRRRPGAFAWRAGLMIGFVVAFFVVLGFASRLPAVSDQCGHCHGIAPAVASWQASAHRDVACSACHSQPGVLGAVNWSLSRVACTLGSADAVQASAGESGCLKCHARLLNTVIVVDGIRVSHQEPLAARMSCISCHPGVGHTAVKTDALTGQPDTNRTKMSNCVGCHDGKKAPAGCSVCHAVSPVDSPTAASEQRTLIPAYTTCKGCHPKSLEKQCIQCHGLELPHPSTWMGQHARRSDLNPPLCMKCHQEAMNSRPCGCHTDVNTHGTFSDWFPRHKAAAAANWPGGCMCHKESFCKFCHPTIPKTQSTGLAAANPNLAPRLRSQPRGNQSGAKGNPIGTGFLGGGIGGLGSLQ